MSRPALFATIVALLLACTSCATSLGLAVGGALDHRHMDVRLDAGHVETLRLGDRLRVRLASGELVSGALVSVLHDSTSGRSGAPIGLRLQRTSHSIATYSDDVAAADRGYRDVPLEGVKSIDLRRGGIGYMPVLAAIGLVADAWLIGQLANIGD